MPKTHIVLKRDKEKVRCSQWLRICYQKCMPPPICINYFLISSEKIFFKNHVLHIQNQGIKMSASISLETLYIVIRNIDGYPMLGIFPTASQLKP